jgi:hypothetical protein
VCRRQPRWTRVNETTIIVAHWNVRFDNERDRLSAFTTRFERPHAWYRGAHTCFPRLLEIVEDELHLWSKICVLCVRCVSEAGGNGHKQEPVCSNHCAPPLPFRRLTRSQRHVTASSLTLVTIHDSIRIMVVGTNAASMRRLAFDSAALFEEHLTDVGVS